MTSSRNSGEGCEAPDQNKMCPQGHDQTNLTEEKRQRIKEQSKQVATYIQAQNEITNFLDELEGFHFVREVFCDDIDRRDYEEIEKWLIAAWELGYEAGKQHGTD
jgi:hypothetical protein